LCFTYPTWFFEVLCEFKGHPLVLEPFQVDYLLDQSTFKITNKTRQAGGSVQLALAKFYKAYTNLNYRADIVSINLKEAADKIKYIRGFYETLPMKYQIPLEIDNALSIGFHKGKSRMSVVNSMAASTGIRGSSKDVAFDEFAHIPNVEELFRSALPAIMNGDLGVDLISTPAGRHNMFGQIWLNEPNERGIKMWNYFSRHKFIWCDVKRFVTDYEGAQQRWYTDYDQNMNRMEELVDEFGNDKLQAIRSMYPWDYFLQEFCGHFVDDRNALFSWDLINSCLKPPLAQLEDQFEPEYLEAWSVELGRPQANTNYTILGVDFGKSGTSNDKTSIQVLERSADGVLRHRYCRNLKQTDFSDFPSQAAVIADVANALGVNKIMADESAMGLGVVPLIRRLVPHITVEGYEFSNQLKHEMVVNLKSLMEQKKVWLLQEEKQLHAEIHGIQATPSPTGKIRYHGEPHDDMFWALALAAKEGKASHFAMYTIDSLLREMAI
jgi:hypothetical protein